MVFQNHRLFLHFKDLLKWTHTRTRIINIKIFFFANLMQKMFACRMSFKINVIRKFIFLSKLRFKRFFDKFLSIRRGMTLFILQFVKSKRVFHRTVVVLYLTSHWVFFQVLALRNAQDQEQDWFRSSLIKIKSLGGLRFFLSFWQITKAKFGQSNPGSRQPGC